MNGKNFNTNGILLMVVAVRFRARPFYYSKTTHRLECHCLSRHVLTALTFSPRGIILCIARTSRLRLVR